MVERRQSEEGNAREGVVSGVVGHVPDQPSHQGRTAQGAGVAERVLLMGEASVLAGVLQVVDPFEQHHGREPEGQSGPVLKTQGNQQDCRVAEKVPPRLGDDLIPLGR